MTRTAEPVPSSATVRDLLESHGVDTSEYGQGAAKTVEHLADEVAKGETELVVDEQGRISRRIAIAAINVLTTDARGDYWELYEKSQEFTDGRRRTRNLPQSLSEKTIPGESPTDATERALTEELGVSDDDIVARYDIGTTDEPPRISNSYPGLATETVKSTSVVVLDPDTAKGSYQEIQSDKTTTYGWRKL